MIADARLAEAVDALDAGDVWRAMAIGARVLAEHPGHAPALLLTGRAALAADEGKAARTLLLGALRQMPGEAADFAALAQQQASAHIERGLALLHARHSEEAILQFEAAVRGAPDHWPAHANLGVALKQAGRMAEAERAYRRALELAPDHPQLLGNLANAVVLRIDGAEEAAALLHRRIAIEPDAAEAWLALGQALRRAGRGRDAEAFCRATIDRVPDHVAAHVTLAMLLLASGEWTEAFREYEWRRSLPGLRSDADPAPEWKGEPIEGRSILLHSEQGLGDVLFFARYVAPLAATGARVAIACDAQLVRVVATVPGIAGAFDNEGPLPAHELHAPLLSVLHLAGFEPLAPASPYLAADPELIATWRPQLPAAPGLRVGLVWAGNPDFPGDAERSLRLGMLLPMIRALPEVSFVAVQKGHGRRHLEGLAEPLPANFHDLGDRIGDFADTAAIMASLDLILSTDSSPAHLAGALHRPSWVLLPPFGDWRWGEAEETTPWYPGMRLWRRGEGEEWESVLERVEAALRDLAARRTAPAAGRPRDGAT